MGAVDFFLDACVDGLQGGENDHPFWWHGCVAGYFWIVSTQVDADYYLQIQAKLRMKTVVQNGSLWHNVNRRTGVKTSHASH